MKCPKCGNVLNDGAMFCGKCGAKIEESEGAIIEKGPSSNKSDSQPVQVTSPGLLNTIRKIATICFILNAIFIFVPVFTNDGVLSTIQNGLSSLTGSAEAQTSYSIVSIFKTVGSGGFYGFAIFLSIIHALMCLLSAYDVFTNRGGKISGLTLAYSKVSVIIVAIIVGVSSGALGYYLGFSSKLTGLYPIAFSANIIFLLIFSYGAGECCEIIKYITKDFNGGSK